MNLKSNEPSWLSRNLNFLRLQFFTWLIVAVGGAALWGGIYQMHLRKQKDFVSIQSKAAQLGVQIRSKCEVTLFGTRCKYTEDPLPVDVLSRAITSMPHCEVAALRAMVDAGHAISVLNVLSAEVSCINKTAEEIAEDQRLNDALAAQRAVLSAP